jgi:UDPglucose 6-dehydrogenase/GDP-mannose 6-dehydrogenase
MRVSIIGTGYVGIVTGACLADKGHKVTCVDTDETKVRKIQGGVAPIFELGLPELLRKHVQRNLFATSDLRQAMLDSEVTLVAVGTPFKGTEIDLTYVKEAARQAGEILGQKSGFHAVAVKSTVVPGTTDDVVTPILEKHSGKKAGKDFGVGMNPEFLTEGQAVADFMAPDRIVLGASDERTLALLQELYASFDGVPLIKTNNKTAEMIKYASNSMLATQISFANELGNLCSALGGVDIVDVMRGLHLSFYLRPRAADGSRVQAPISSFLEAGCGYGGSCLPKDVSALIAHGRKAGVPMPLLSAVIEVNRLQPGQIIRLLQKRFPSLANLRIAVLGLSFKPDTDDMRESPAIPIIRQLLGAGAVLKAYDPVANAEARKIFTERELPLCDSLEQALGDIDAAVLVTRWDEFKSAPQVLKKTSPDAVFVDGRRCLDKKDFARYEGIGL